MELEDISGIKREYLKDKMPLKQNKKQEAKI
jgi:hypothetical protein